MDASNKMVCYGLKKTFGYIFLPQPIREAPGICPKLGPGCPAPVAGFLPEKAAGHRPAV